MFNHILWVVTQNENSPFIAHSIPPISDLMRHFSHGKFNMKPIQKAAQGKTSFQVVQDVLW